MGKTCSACGNRNMPEDMYCMNCGAKLQGAESGFDEREGLEKPLTLPECLLIGLIILIPIVNVIVLLIWAFGNQRKSFRNVARAALIYLGLFMGLVAVIVIGAVQYMGSYVRGYLYGNPWGNYEHYYESPYGDYGDYGDMLEGYDYDDIVEYFQTYPDESMEDFFYEYIYPSLPENEGMMGNKPEIDI